MKTQRLITYLLTLCLCGVYLFSIARPTALYAQAGGPTLTIPTGIQAGSPGTVAVPIVFQRNQSGVAALTFSITYDPACLVIDSDAAEEAVAFSLPTQMRGSVLFDADDLDGQVDIAIADYAPPFSTLPDSDPLVTITFTVVCTPDEGTTITTPVNFSQSPPASFSNTLGRAIDGSVTNGTVIIQDGPLPTPTPPVEPTPEPTSEPVNTAPNAVDDSVTTREYRAVTIDVLANDADPDGDELSITAVTAAGLGQVAIQADGTILYTPDPGRNGEDLFAYTLSDGRGGLAEGLVSVTITDFNVPPNAQDDTITTQRNRSIAVDVLANDFDVDTVDDAPGLVIVVVGQPLLGSTELAADNTITFSPRPGYVGQDEFWYTVLDSEGGSDVAKVTVTVTPFNVPPEIDPPTEIAFEAGQEILLQFLATDADGDTNLQFSATGLPPGLTIDPNTGEISGIVDPANIGNYVLTVTVSDGQATVSLDYPISIVLPAEPDDFIRYLPFLGR